MQTTAQLQANIKRREKDVMKLMMSGKFDVQLVNEDSTQEFDVLFEGPADSHYEGVSHRETMRHLDPRSKYDYSDRLFIFTGHMESSSTAPRPLPIQVAFHRLQKQNIPSQHRRSVSANSVLK